MQANSNGESERLRGPRLLRSQTGTQPLPLRRRRDVAINKIKAIAGTSGTPPRAASASASAEEGGKYGVHSKSEKS